MKLLSSIILSSEIWSHVCGLLRIYELYLHTINTIGQFQLLKCFYISTDWAHDSREICQYSYSRQAKGESEPHGSHLILTLAQTNKLYLWGISASVNNYFGLFATHSFTNSTFMWDPNSLVSGDDSFVHSQYGRPVVLKCKVLFNKY